METEKGLEEFVKAMKLKLDLNEKEKGNSWSDCEIGFLEEKLSEEIFEMHEAPNDHKKAQELIDVANICMMLYHRYFDRWAQKAGDDIFGKSEVDGMTVYAQNHQNVSSLNKGLMKKCKHGNPIKAGMVCYACMKEQHGK